MSFALVKRYRQQSLFGSSGIRRKVDKDLMSIVLRVGLGVGKEHRRVVVGCDTRTSSEAVKHCLVSGLVIAGARVYDAGVVPTPTLGFIARDFDVAAMVTASHNPPEYNGVKLLNSDGSAFDALQRQNIEEQVLADSCDTALWHEIGNGTVLDGAVIRHVERILDDFPCNHKLKVVVDCGCGAAYGSTPYLLRRMGCEVVSLNCHATGFFPRNIEPTESSLKDLMRLTLETGADLGIAHDGDADRMVAVDDRGRFVPGDALLAVFAREVGARKIVTTIDASMAVDALGLDVTRTKVGDIYVSEELRHSGGWGGEPCGSWIFPTVSLCPDGIYAAALLVGIAGRHRLSDLVDRVPAYSILRGSTSGVGVDMHELESRLASLQPLDVSDIDGFRLEFGDGWLLIRPSGTEPKIRLVAEGKTERRAQEIYIAGLGLLESCTHSKSR